MTIYLDTSALAKLAIIEAETDALRDWLGRRSGAVFLTNTIGMVELQRQTARVSLEALGAAVMVLARIDVLELTPASIALAPQLPPPEVRTLDAFHVASAALLPDLEVLVTYDQRTAQAARAYGLTVESPGW